MLANNMIGLGNGSWVEVIERVIVWLQVIILRIHYPSLSCQFLAIVLQPLDQESTIIMPNSFAKKNFRIETFDKVNLSYFLKS